MGTRSLTIFQDEDRNEIGVLYRQFDGYLSGHGADLKALAAETRIVNGYTEEDTGQHKEMIRSQRSNLEAAAKAVPDEYSPDPIEQAISGIPIAVANGMRGLACNLISRLAFGLGGFYLHEAGTRNWGEEYIYILYLVDGRVHVRVSAIYDENITNLPYEGPLSDMPDEDIWDEEDCDMGIDIYMRRENQTEEGDDE